MLKLFVSLGLMISSLSFAAPSDPDHIMLRPRDITWAEAPASLPAGAKVAVLYGDPSAAGPFSMRLKVPAKYKVAPHFHSQDENITVISGTFLMAMGDDSSISMTSLPAGSFAHMKAGSHHFARAKSETIVQINANGPWDITYVNPDDDPRK